MVKNLQCHGGAPPSPESVFGTTVALSGIASHTHGRGLLRNTG
jgi:hypothetical protein